MSLFKGKRNDRVGLLVAAVIFGLVAIVQLWRAVTGVSVQLGGHMVPLWFSVIAGIVALLMAFWLGAILRRNRPVL